MAHRLSMLNIRNQFFLFLTRYSVTRLLILTINHISEIESYSFEKLKSFINYAHFDQIYFLGPNSLLGVLRHFIFRTTKNDIPEKSNRDTTWDDERN